MKKEKSTFLKKTDFRFTIELIVITILFIIIMMRMYDLHEKTQKLLVKKFDQQMDAMVMENNELFARLLKYEQEDIVYAKNWIMNNSYNVDVKTIQTIATAICEYSEEYDLDYKIVLALIWQESRFRVGATSNKEARGLMQIIPSTQKIIAKWLEMETWDIEDIDTNIKFGCAYLARLKVIYKNNLTLMLASYNGGPVQAKKYRKFLNGEIPSDSLNYENYNYVRSILNKLKRNEQKNVKN